MAANLAVGARQLAAVPAMSSEREQLEAGIAALEAQRSVLGDAVTDASLAGLRTRLAALDNDALSPAQQLEQASIVFLDVVGSTTLSQHLDPEEIHAVMDGALERCTAVVVAHQGRVLQYAGDNLLAAFGADQAREDDAERAVRCGLALLAEGRALGDEDVIACGGLQWGLQPQRFAPWRDSWTGSSAVRILPTFRSKRSPSSTSS